jgi:hypothetical protein
MKQFLLSVHYVEGQPPPDPETMQRMFDQVDAVNKEMQAAKAWVFGGGLEPPTIATVVREDNGQIIATDGPFPEAKEQLGGFWVIKCDDRAAALRWAEKATRACLSPVEVRPFQDDAEE